MTEKFATSVDIPGEQKQPAAAISIPEASASNENAAGNKLPQPAVPVMAPAHLFHFQGLSAADAMRVGAHLAVPRPDPYGFVPPRYAMSHCSKKNRNNNKAPWTKEEDEEVSSS